MRVKVTVAVLVVVAATSASTAWALSSDPSTTPPRSAASPQIDTTPTGWSCERPTDPTRSGTDSVRKVFTGYPVNGHGQTYGQRFVGGAIGYPDLLAATAHGFDKQFVDGYVVRCDTESFDSDGRVLPLFASDGVTVIGYWQSADNRHPVMQSPTRE